MSVEKTHPYLAKLHEQFANGKVDRREFLRTSTLLGLSATAAYAFVGKVTGDAPIPAARADMPKGGRVRIGMRVLDLSSPHAYSWFEEAITRQVCEYVTKTGHDNVTRPYLAERWEASEDLKTWTFHLRKDVTWHNGRAFTSDDVIWNLQHALDPKSGSSMLGLMKGYMMNEVGDSAELWDANAIEKLDDHSFRLNTKEPQLAVPEHFFHYPMLILDPEEGGTFKAGSNGTGPFELVENTVGERALLKARQDYWGEGPYLDEVLYVDLGDDAGAQIAALASKQVDGLYRVQVSDLDVVKALPHVTLYQTPTAQTAVARMRSTEPPFDNPKVRKALRLATDANSVLQAALRGEGVVAEHHHVCPIHPEYAELPQMTRDPAAAKALLAEAGFADGIDIEIAGNNDAAWEVAAIQIMVEQWREANIRCKINIMPGAAYWDVWDKVPFGVTSWTHRPLGVMVLGLAYRSGVPWNESAYSNPEFDRLLTKAEGILDVDERRVVMAEIEALMQEDGPIIQPAWRSEFTAYDSRVKGFQMHPTSYIFANDLAVEPS